MSYTDFDFPHTRFYQSDLREVLSMYTSLVNDYEVLTAWMAEHKTEYSGLLARVVVLENTIDSFEKKVEETIESMEAEIYANMKVELATATTSILKEVASEIAELVEPLTLLQTNLALLASEVARNKIDASSAISAYYDLSKQYTDDQIQELIDSLPDLRTVYVENPIRGYTTNIQTAIDDLYYMFRFNGLTAFEYDELRLTAEEYDELGLTAQEYDLYARYLLEQAGVIKNKYHYMHSPFTGDYVPLKDVIEDLAALHRLYALTATEYDAIEITAYDYDALEISAYNYDWYGKNLVS